MQASAVDYPQFFRRLCDFQREGSSPLRDDNILDRERFDAWAAIYAARLAAEHSDDRERAVRMKQVNPKYVLRNWVAQSAINAARQGDFTVVNDVLKLLQSPFAEWPEHAQYAQPPPDWGRRMSISCSS
jgi:uncharacterized protein YdiU (UPF0061 family)